MIGCWMIVFISIMISPSGVMSMDETLGNNSDSIYTFVEKAPEFRGGLEALQMYLNLSLVYPGKAINEGIHGTVYVQFVVEKDGSLSNSEIIRSLGGGCDEEALRVVNEMPPWIPGKIKHRTVRVKMTFPVKFILVTQEPDILETYLEADRMPYFYGGQIELDNYFLKTLAYPEQAENENVSGIVNVNFVVERDGGISKIVVVDSLGFGCDEEAVKVVSEMPLWIPGMINEVPVRVLLSISIEFPPPLTYAEEMPEYPGGTDNLMKYLGANITYPVQAKENGIQGKVWVNFIVEQNGMITHIKVTKGIGGGCDEEAMRVIGNMPNWIPGKNNGKPVRVSYNVPLKFTLQ